MKIISNKKWSEINAEIQALKETVKQRQTEKDKLLNKNFELHQNLKSMVKHGNRLQNDLDNAESINLLLNKEVELLKKNAMPPRNEKGVFIKKNI
jgi:predicted  nucleic acid-binding Zn-ribbon protein